MALIYRGKTNVKMGGAMSTLKYLTKITRPLQCLLGGTTAWTIALLSNGPTWFTVEKVAAGAVISLSIVASSFWHYGARADVYAKKHWDPVFVKRPWVLMCAGIITFLASVILAAIFLPAECAAIAILNAIVIILYAKRLDQLWPFKNISIAAVCVTPLLLGWFSGHRLNPIVPSIISATFFVYLSREIFKDVVDIEANRGKRFTMVMSLGPIAAQRVGGVSLAFAIALIFFSIFWAPAPDLWVLPFAIGTGWLSWFAVKALNGENIAIKFPWMDIGTAMILLSLLGMRVGMY